MEACRIIITQEPSGLINVSAPMKHKELCYEMLEDAITVINYAPEKAFIQPDSKYRTLIITMQMSGLVDVSAPMPNKEICLMLIDEAFPVIEEFESTEVKHLKSGYADSLSPA